MTTMLTNHGDDLALVLDRATLKTLGIDEGTPLEVVVDETGIHIVPKRNDRQAQVLASALRMMEIHDETFRKLAL
jgi:antitoxin component of MazEF toxin-antitoxin module